jgi:inner membrane protein
MKWTSHLLIGGAVCAVFQPAAAPVCMAGAIAPDVLETIIPVITGKPPIRHRTVTHYLVFWLLPLGLSHWFDFGAHYLFWFCWGGVTHWLCDAVTIHGAPIAWWSKTRTSLMGGKIRTGSTLEYMITTLIVAACVALMIFTRSYNNGDSNNHFSPYFMPWHQLYQTGVIDAFEYRQHRFSLF